MMESARKNSPVFKGRTLGVIGVVVFAMGIIANIPANVAVSAVTVDDRFGYSDISGTIWHGEIKNAAYRGANIGDITFTTSAARLAMLSLRSHLTAAGGAIDGEGDITISITGTMKIDHAFADIQLPKVTTATVLGQPVVGIARLNIDTVTLQNMKCRNASGDVWTNVLNATTKRMRGYSFPLAGPVTCDGDDVLVRLAGGSEDGKMEITLRLKPDRTYEVETIAMPEQQDVSSALKAFGFEDANGALTHRSSGALNGVSS